MRRWTRLGVICGVVLIIGNGCADRQETFEWTQGPMAQVDGCQIHLLAIRQSAHALHLRLSLVNLTKDDLCCTPTRTGPEHGEQSGWLVVHSAAQQVTVQGAIETSVPYESNRGFQRTLSPIVDGLILPAHSSLFIEVDVAIDTGRSPCWLSWHAREASDRNLELRLDIPSPAEWKQPERMSDSQGPLP
jgi:hypothetical protein